jgi:hypothetical protein
VAGHATLSPRRDLDLVEDVEDPPDLPISVRIDVAHQAWKDANGAATIRQICRTFKVNPSTLHSRIHSATPKALASQAMQRLTVPKEKSMRSWLLDLSS